MYSVLNHARFHSVVIYFSNKIKRVNPLRVSRLTRNFESSQHILLRAFRPDITSFVNTIKVSDSRSMLYHQFLELLNKN